MTTEDKALKLLNDCGGKHTYLKREWNPRYEALCRAIEQHEAFRQEVSDALQVYEEMCWPMWWEGFERFIIPAPKPDPLVEIIELLNGEWTPDEYANAIRAALEARGLKIRGINT